MSIVEFSKEELEFIMDVTRYEKYIDKLINKARETGKLSIDELDELEISSRCEGTEILGDEFDYDCCDWKIKLITGEEIKITIEENEPTNNSYEEWADSDDYSNLAKEYAKEEKQRELILEEVLNEMEDEIEIVFKNTNKTME